MHFTYLFLNLGTKRTAWFSLRHYNIWVSDKPLAQDNAVIGLLQVIFRWVFCGQNVSSLLLFQEKLILVRYYRQMELLCKISSNYDQKLSAKRVIKPSFPGHNILWFAKQ